MGFEPTISAGERPKTYALDLAATGNATNTDVYSQLVNSQHVSGIIMPIVKRTRLYKTACGVSMVVLAVVVWSWDASCVHCMKVVLAVVVWSWDASCVHCMKVVIRIYIDYFPIIPLYYSYSTYLLHGAESILRS